MVKNDKILVSEIFESIDGEGYHAGYATVFFRTIGCNLRCEWCDSKYTFTEDKNCNWYTVEKAFEEVNKYGLKHITITGGEPLLIENKRWMINFIHLLLINGFTVDVETNGSINYLDWKKEFTAYKNRFVLITDWKAPGSKMNKFMLKDNLAILDEWDLIKIVVKDEDFEEVEKVLNSQTKAQIYISPVFDKVIMEKIPEFIMKHKQFSNLRCQIQLHKIFWNPDKRGV